MASTALASPALAKDDSWYIGAEFGSMLVEDSEFDVNDGSDNLNYATATHVRFLLICNTLSKNPKQDNMESDRLRFCDWRSNRCRTTYNF